MQAERPASLGSLVAGVAHEINTPIGIAHTSASVLKDAADEMQAALAGDGLKKSAVLRCIATAVESSRLIMNNAGKTVKWNHFCAQYSLPRHLLHAAACARYPASGAGRCR